MASNDGKKRVVLCNTEDDDDGINNLRDIISELKNVELYREIELGAPVYDYIECALQVNDYGVLKVPKEGSQHVVGVVSQELQWKQYTTQKIIPVYDSPQDCKSTHEDFLRQRPLFMKGDDGSDNPNFRAELRQAITEGRQIQDLIPLGNASSGLAVNYLTVINFLLEEEFENMFNKQCQEWESEKPGMKFNRVPKVVMAIPEGCAFKGKLKDCGREILEEHVLEARKMMHGSMRFFTLSMFQLHDKQTNEIYIVPIEGPNILSTLDKMCIEDKNTTIENVKKLTKDQMKTQRDTFVNKTDAFLKATKKNRYIIVHYQEDKKDLGKVVLEAIKADQQQSSVQSSDTQEENSTCLAYINWDDQKLTQEEGVKQFQESLEDQGITVVDSYRDFSKAKSEAIVFVWITDEKLSEKQKKECQEFLYYQDVNKFVQLVPVIADDKPIHADYFYLSRLNCLKTSDASHIKDAIDACKGERPLGLPLGPVYQGLVWTASLNYLKPMMPKRVALGLKNRQGQWQKSIRELCQELKASCPKDKQVVCYPKMILLTEKGCRDVVGKAFYTFEGFDDGERIEETMEAEGIMPIKKIVTQGVQKFVYGDKIYIAAFEYVRAVTALREIRDSKLLPVSQQQIEDSCAKFNELFSKVAHKNIPEIRDYTELLTYDEDEPGNKNEKGELRLNKILAEFIESHPQDEQLQYAYKTGDS